MSIETLEMDKIYRRGSVKVMMGIPNVGRSIAEKKEELIRTGKLEYK